MGRGGCSRRGEGGRLEPGDRKTKVCFLKDPFIIDSRMEDVVKGGRPEGASELSHGGDRCLAG